MRDEGPYILEWLAFHQAIGFTDFLIYTNDCRDGTDLLLDRLQQNGILTHERNRVLRRGPHKSALKYAKEHEAYQSADWVYVCDVDEFLNIKIGNGQVDDLIKHFGGADAIPVVWKMFSNNAHEELFPGFAIDVFTDAQPASPENDRAGRFVKALFRPSEMVERIGLHGPIYAEESAPLAEWGAPWVQADPDADPRRPTQDFGYEIAQVNHYAVRSIDAFLIKRDRGRANHVHDSIGLDYWKRWCLGGELDDSVQRHRPAFIDRLKQLRSDPVVAHLEAGCRAFQTEMLAKLLKRPDIQELKSEILQKNGQLKDFATPTSAETRALEVKAPKRHQNRLHMLEQMPKGGRCAEIGVWNGGFSGPILEVTQPTELVLIDPWDLLSGQNEDEWTHKHHKDHEVMKGMFDNVSTRYGAMSNVSIKKGFSADVLEEYPDEYFDWVYIDGNHRYEFVLKDLDVSFRKVRKGGIIAGDDFFWKRDGRMHVREAVLDTMRRLGMANRPTRIGQQYMITVPK